MKVLPIKFSKLAKMGLFPEYNTTTHEFYYSSEMLPDYIIGDLTEHNSTLDDLRLFASWANRHKTEVLKLMINR